jgi:hypothetical protein
MTMEPRPPRARAFSNSRACLRYNFTRCCGQCRDPHIMKRIVLVGVNRNAVHCERIRSNSLKELGSGFYEHHDLLDVRLIQ